MRTESVYYCENCNYKHHYRFNIGKCEICSKEICDECCTDQKSGCLCCSDPDCKEIF